MHSGRGKGRGLATKKSKIFKIHETCENVFSRTQTFSHIVGFKFFQINSVYLRVLKLKNYFFSGAKIKILN